MLALPIVSMLALCAVKTVPAALYWTATGQLATHDGANDPRALIESPKRMGVDVVSWVTVMEVSVCPTKAGPREKSCA